MWETLESRQLMSGTLGSATLLPAVQFTSTPVTTITKSLETATKNLEAQDRMGNFEIQNLMSRYNQAETLG